MVARDEGKADPRPIVRGHFHTLVDARTGTARPRDLGVMFGVPLVAAASSLVLELRLETSVVAGLLTVAGLAGAFLFQLSVQLLDTITAWADSDPERTPQRARQARLYRELSANTAYASLLALVTSVGLVVTAVAPDGLVRSSFGSLAVLLLVHFTVTLLMVLRRVYMLSIERLDDVRTGIRRH